ncbi:unnamed protein product [Gadus morhua 'NCC']
MSNLVLKKQMTMLLKDKSPTVGGNVAGGTSSEAYSSLHAGTPSQHQGSLDEPETHDLQDCIQEVFSKCSLLSSLPISYFLFLCMKMSQLGPITWLLQHRENQ